MSVSTRSITRVISGTASLEWLLFSPHQGQSTWEIIKPSIHVKPLVKHPKDNSLLAFWVVLDGMSNVVNFTLLLIGSSNSPWNVLSLFLQLAGNAMRLAFEQDQSSFQAHSWGRTVLRHVTRFLLWLVGIRSTSSILCEARNGPACVSRCPFFDVFLHRHAALSTQLKTQGEPSRNLQKILCATPSSSVSSVGLVSPNSQLCLFNSGRLPGLVWVPPLYAEPGDWALSEGSPFISLL